MKICSKCNIEKDEGFFYKRKDSKDGLRAECKECFNITSKKYVENNKDEIKKYKKKYYISNKELIIDRSKQWMINNPDSYKNIQNKYNNKESSKINRRRYYNEKYDYYLIKSKEYKENNKDKLNELHRDRYKSDNLYRLRILLRNSIYKSLRNKGFVKESKSEEILGCSFEYIKKHLELNFEPWMTWDNYGLYNGDFNYGWDIDHIIPLSSAKTEEDLIKLNHYTNLQPLCSKINRDIKRDKTWIYFSGI